MQPTKHERETLAALGVKIPRSTNARSSKMSWLLDWDDIGDFEVSCRCPWCEATIIVTDETEEEIDCTGCGKRLLTDLGDVSIEFDISLHPTITETDRKYLASREEVAVAPTPTTEGEK